MSEYQDKIYIIGSVSQAKEIEEVANYFIRKNRYRVKYVKAEPNKSLSLLVEECFKNIIWADRVEIIPKPDGSLGNGVIYEKVFARLLGKRIDIAPDWLLGRE